METRKLSGRLLDRNGILYPMLVIAAVAVIVFSAFGVATMTGLLPRAESMEGPHVTTRPRLAGVTDRMCTNCGVIESINSSTTLNGVTLSAGTNYVTPNNTVTILQGTITNNGTIALNSGGNLTDLHIMGPLTLAGTGTVNMGNNPNNRIYAPNGTDTLTIKQTIQGAGQLGVGLTKIVNQSIIDANLSTTLVVDPNSSGLTNTGTLEATNGGTLDLQGLYTNTGGTIKALVHALTPASVSPVPKQQDYCSPRGFAALGAPDVGALGWEEFVWREQPFAFHVGSVHATAADYQPALRAALQTFAARMPETAPAMAGGRSRE